MEKEITGIVISVSKQRWLKINRKPIRLHTMDGAVFPHIIKVRYTAEGTDYTCRKWVPANAVPPGVGSPVQVRYDADRPSRARVAL